MDPGAWLVLAFLLSTGQPYSIAWPAPSLFVCEKARSVIPQPTQSETFCTLQKPKADAYGPPLPATTS